MGLKNNAIHAMLANPHLAPFDLIERPLQRQDWILIDHLMEVYKVKAHDYVEEDSRASIVNMARTLASGYISESAGSRCVVLVKDGARAQKPAVRESRQKRQPAPHVEFCKRNLPAIEYTAMKLLSDMGMKNKLFLVTGAKENFTEDCLPQGSSGDNVVSFHHKYLDYQERRDDSPLEETLDDLLKPLEFQLSDVDPFYADGEITRPEEIEGVFIATFADPETGLVSDLRRACLRCKTTEADTLLVELANVLEGSVTVCTGDSDVVAVLTASGREGVTLRLDNKSYRAERDMHMTVFSQLLFATPGKLPQNLSRDVLLSSGHRFRALYDIDEEDEGSVETSLMKQHEAFEALLDERGAKSGFKENVARYLYLGGIRGPLYSTFVSRVLKSKAKDPLFHGLALAVDGEKCPRTSTVHYAFEMLCPASEESLRSGYEWAERPYTSEKRKASCLEEDEARAGEENRKRELDFDDYGSKSTAAVPSIDPCSGLSSFKRLSKVYIAGMVPTGSYGRFLRLNRTGRHFFMRVKPAVVRDERVRTAKLFFMALCGTDYNKMPAGLGIKRLLSAVVAKERSFFWWCHELTGLWDTGSPKDCYEMFIKLAKMTKVHCKTRSKFWTEAKCVMAVKTMKYVCELWSLKRPRLGLEYGFSVRDDGTVYFDMKDCSLVDATGKGDV